ncbi:hypothetical protein QEG73_00980 [Chitinophagaceae bacterium 26-R-25]|nr:hypothetical protein [Chitinophagaceae bacterium 26-R-25]
MLVRIKLFFFIYLVCHTVTFCQVGKTKTIKLNRNEISCVVPNDWKVIEKSMRFAVSEIKYDVEVRDKKGRPFIALYVYDSAYSFRKYVNDSIVNDEKKEKQSDSNREVIILDWGLKMVNGVQVGYLKYSFKQNKDGARAYGIDVFYCNNRGISNKMEIRGIGESLESFKEIADRIFDSIDIHSE